MAHRFLGESRGEGTEMGDLPLSMIKNIFISNPENGNNSGWLAQLAERRSLAGELTLFYPRPVADG